MRGKCLNCNAKIEVSAERYETGKFKKLGSMRVPITEWEYWTIRDCDCELDETEVYHLKEGAKAEFYHSMDKYDEDLVW